MEKRRKRGKKDREPEEEEESKRGRKDQDEARGGMAGVCAKVTEGMPRKKTGLVTHTNGAARDTDDAERRFPAECTALGARRDGGATKRKRSREQIRRSESDEDGLRGDQGKDEEKLERKRKKKRGKEGDENGERRTGRRSAGEERGKAGVYVYARGDDILVYPAPGYVRRGARHFGAKGGRVGREVTGRRVEK